MSPILKTYWFGARTVRYVYVKGLDESYKCLNYLFTTEAKQMKALALRMQLDIFIP